MKKYLKRILKITIKKEEVKTVETPSDLDRLKKYGRRNKTNLKLHIGSGPRVLKGWINIDLAFEPYEQYLQYYKDEFYGPEIRGKRSEFFAIDITQQPLPLPDKSVAVVFHEDFLEHLDQKEQILFLAETYRLLKKGGVHRINTPDLSSSMKLNSRFKEGYNGVYQYEWDHHIHKNVLTKKMLKELAEIVGYSKVIIQKRNKSQASGLPKEYRPDPNDRPESGNIFIDLIK